jgi:hypothetical protein
MYPAEKVAHAFLEGIVAVRAAQPSCRLEITERRGAESAARGITLRRLHGLMNTLEKIRDLRLRSGRIRLHSALCGAALTEMQQAHACALYLCELHYRIGFLANVADHSAPPTR